LIQAEDANKLLELIAPLVRDEEGQIEPSEEEFAEEQTLIARMIHLFHHEEADRQYLVLPILLTLLTLRNNLIKPKFQQ